MTSRDLTMDFIFLSQTAVGILGNSVLLCHLILADSSGSKAKPTDLIVKHLTCANLMVLLFKGIPQAMVAFGLIYFLDDITCKLVFYFHRVARGMCLGSTALLSTFQSITISPSNSKWVWLKGRAPKITGPSLGVCWTLQLIINIFIPMNVIDIWRAKNLTGINDYVYCAVINLHSLINTLNGVFLLVTDVLCLGLMTWASGSMVFELLRHKQRVQHLHNSLSARLSPETRATQSILALASTFAVFYITSAILTMCLTHLDRTTRWLVNTSAAMTACFPALCPFLLIRHYAALSRLCCTPTSQTALKRGVTNHTKREEGEG